MKSGGETIASSSSSSSLSEKASPNMEETRKLMEFQTNTGNTNSIISSTADGDAVAVAFAGDDRHESYPSDRDTSRDVDDDYPRRPLLSTNGVDDNDDDHGSGGPTSNDSGANEVGRTSFPPAASTPRITSSSIFRDDTTTSNTRGGGASVIAIPTVTTTLQPFDISLTQTAFKSPGGGGMAAALGFPFTVAQWKELERQAMVYKYMVASLPVPPDLLIPVNTRNFSDPSVPLGCGSLYSLRYQNRDPEPGRCKRTDGKKWRCSRDVAPHQKYCERHMHRGRPRSRKHVEVHPSVDTNNNKKTRLNQTPPLQSNPTGQQKDSFPPLFPGTVGQTKDALVLGGPRASATTQNLSPSPYKESNRMIGRMMQNGEMVAATNGVEQQWLHLMDPRRGLPAERQFYGTNGSILHHGFAEDQPLNLFSYTDLTQEDIRSRNEDCHLFLNNSDLISLKQPQMDDFPISRDFIDAWSNGNLGNINNEPSMSSSQGNLSPSSLNLSIAMAAGDVLDTQMGLSRVVHHPPPSAAAGVAEHEHREPKYFPASWLPFSSGGPLAEVLQPSNICGGSNPASPYATNTDSISSPATAVSSPSGVLQRALFSQSDGSVCNSPTIAVSAAPQEVVPFQWFS